MWNIQKIGFCLLKFNYFIIFFFNLTWFQPIHNVCKWLIQGAWWEISSSASTPSSSERLVFLCLINGLEVKYPPPPSELQSLPGANSWFHAVQTNNAIGSYISTTLFLNKNVRFYVKGMWTLKYQWFQIYCQM